jgi:hypothetical protein
MRDAIVRTAQKYSNLDRVTVEFDKLERRGARALGRTGRSFGRQRRGLERDVERSANGLRAEAGGLIERVKQIV